MSKNVDPEGPHMTIQYGTYMFRAGYARLQACTHIHMPTHPGTCTHPRVHADKYVLLTVFPFQQCLCELASMLCYPYIAYFVFVIVVIVLAFNNDSFEVTLWNSVFQKYSNLVQLSRTLCVPIMPEKSCSWHQWRWIHCNEQNEHFDIKLRLSRRSTWDL
jgi:hypothetical protein